MNEEDRPGLMRTYSVAEQCIVLLRQLAASHPTLELPAGSYGQAFRRLDRAVLFLVAELEGLRRDTGFDPSATPGAWDGTEDPEEAGPT